MSKRNDDPLTPVRTTIRQYDDELSFYDAPPLIPGDDPAIDCRGEQGDQASRFF